MTFTRKLIKIVKTKQGLSSDYSIAKLIGVTPQKFSHWVNEKSDADAESTIKLMAAGDVSAREAVRMYEEGSAQIALLAVTAIGCITYILAFLRTPLCILC